MIDTAATTAPTTTRDHDAQPRQPASSAGHAGHAGLIDQRIERLSTASLKRVLEPVTDVPSAIGDGQVLPDELVSPSNVPELYGRLTDAWKRTLAREEFASIVDTGVGFESVLMAGFSFDILSRAPTSPTPA